MTFDYQAEKLGEARKSLATVLPGGEAEALADALHWCSQGLHQLDVTAVDEGVHHWLAVVQAALDTAGLEDPAGIGVWTVKALQMSADQRLEFKRAVDALASWFAKYSSAPGARRR